MLHYLQALGAFSIPPLLPRFRSAANTASWSRSKFPHSPRNQEVAPDSSGSNLRKHSSVLLGSMQETPATGATASALLVFCTFTGIRSGFITQIISTRFYSRCGISSSSPGRWLLTSPSGGRSRPRNRKGLALISPTTSHSAPGAMEALVCKCFEIERNAGSASRPPQHRVKATRRGG